MARCHGLAAVTGLFTLWFGLPCAGQVWTSIGPNPINTGDTGRMISLAFDPADSTHWLAGASAGGILGGIL